MKNALPLLLLAGLAVAGCTGPVIMGTDAAVTVATKPWGSPPADTADQIPQHESWCYQTMGDTQCYAHIQDVPPYRLINVDPQSIYPLDPEAYHQAVAARKNAVSGPAIEAPVPLEPVASTPVQPSERELLDKEIQDSSPPAAPAQK